MKSTEKKTFKEAAIEALKEAGKPLSALDISSIAQRRGWIEPKSKTPEASISAALYTDMKNKGDDSAFDQPEAGLFDLSHKKKQSIAKSEQVVYVMTTRAMPHYVKVGITTEYGLNNRRKTMSSTSVPFPFKIYYAAVVEDSKGIERKISKIFEDKKVHERKEFYEISAEKMKLVISMAAKRVISPAEQEPGANPPVDPVVVQEKPGEGSKTSSVKQEKKEKTPPFRFNHIQIRPGSILYFVKDKEITCEVADDRHVIYKGEKILLGKASELALNSKGYYWKGYQGINHWEYNGRKLKDIRDSVKQNSGKISQDSPEAGKKERAPLFRFNHIQIRPGSTLTFAEDASITCEVADDLHVIYKGEKMRLSNAAKEAWKLKGHLGKAYRGSKHWKYNGRILQDILDSI